MVTKINDHFALFGTGPDAINSTDIPNMSSVTGANVTDALNSLFVDRPVISTTLFVDVNGNDTTGDGTLHKPYATLYKAMSMITDATPTKRYAIKLGIGFFTEAQAIIHKPNVWIFGENAYSTRLTLSSTYGIDSAFAGAADNRFGWESIFVSGNLTWNMNAVGATNARMYARNCQFNSAVSFTAYAATSRCYLFNCETFSTSNISGGYFHSINSVFNGLVTLSSLALTSCNHYVSNSYLPNGLTVSNPLTTEYIDVWLMNSQVRSSLTATGYSGLHYSFGSLPIVAARSIASTVVMGSLGNESGTDILNPRKQISSALYYMSNVDYIVGVDTSAARTIVLPSASMVNDGAMFVIKDETGNAGTNNITINRSSTDTIEGLTSLSININYGIIELYRAGTGKWALMPHVKSASEVSNNSSVVGTTVKDALNTLLNKKYAEAWFYTPTGNASTSMAIDTQNLYHSLVLATTSDVINGFTHKVGQANNIASVANNNAVSPNTILVTTTGNHNLAIGDFITHTGFNTRTTYRGKYQVVTTPSPTTYTIARAYETSTDTGFMKRSLSLKANVGTSGIFAIKFNATISVASSNKNIKVEVNKNLIDLDNIAAEQVLSTSNGQLIAEGLVSIAEGDTIWMSIANTTDSVDVLIRHLNLTLN
jgi:hypothetical protein